MAQTQARIDHHGTILEEALEGDTTLVKHALTVHVARLPWTGAKAQLKRVYCAVIDLQLEEIGVRFRARQRANFAVVLGRCLHGV